MDDGQMQAITAKACVYAVSLECQGSPKMDRYLHIGGWGNLHSQTGYSLVREMTDLPDLLTKTLYGDAKNRMYN